MGETRDRLHEMTPLGTRGRRRLGAVLAVCAGLVVFWSWPGEGLIEVQPTTLDFGAVDAGATVTARIEVFNRGTASVRVSELQTEGDFALAEAENFLLAPSESKSLMIRYASPSLTSPASQGALRFTTSDSEHPRVSVALRGRVARCSLRVNPQTFDVGRVPLFQTQRSTFTLRNAGDLPCTVDDFALAPETDSHFAMPSADAIHIPPHGAASLALDFRASDMASPRRRTGSLTFACDDPTQGRRALPLAATIDSVCTEQSRDVFPIDGKGTLFRFDPLTGELMELSVLTPPGASGPWSMTIDDRGGGWVLLSDGTMSRVDLQTGLRAPTSFVAPPGFHVFGMGAFFDVEAGQETLMVSSNTVGQPAQSRLGMFSPEAGTVSDVGPMSLVNAELAGTGDGELWAFGEPSILDQIDPHSGATLEHHDLELRRTRESFAMKYIAGAFYVFIGGQVWRVERSTLVPGLSAPVVPPVLLTSSPTRMIVGAAGSTCAPNF